MTVVDENPFTALFETTAFDSSIGADVAPNADVGFLADELPNAPNVRPLSAVAGADARVEAGESVLVDVEGAAKLNAENGVFVAVAVLLMVGCDVVAVLEKADDGTEPLVFAADTGVEETALLLKLNPEKGVFDTAAGVVDGAVLAASPKTEGAAGADAAKELGFAAGTEPNEKAPVETGAPKEGVDVDALDCPNPKAGVGAGAAACSGIGQWYLDVTDFNERTAIFLFGIPRILKSRH